MNLKILTWASALCVCCLTVVLGTASAQFNDPTVYPIPNTYGVGDLGYCGDGQGNIYILSNQNNISQVLYQVSSSGVFTTLHIFDSTDAVYSPTGNLFADANGDVYGTAKTTTTYVPPGQTSTQVACDVLWEIPANRTLKTLYTFEQLPYHSAVVSGEQLFADDAPTGQIAVDNQGDVYGASTPALFGDPDETVLWEVENTGAFHTLTNTGQATSFLMSSGSTDQEICGQGLLLDPTGRIFAANSLSTAIYVRSITGAISVAHSFTKADSGQAGVSNVTSDSQFTADELGNTYGEAVATNGTAASSADPVVLWKIDTSGNFSVLSSAGIGFLAPDGLPLDTSGNVYGTADIPDPSNLPTQNSFAITTTSAGGTSNYWPFTSNNVDVGSAFTPVVGNGFLIGLGLDDSSQPNVVYTVSIDSSASVASLPNPVPLGTAVGAPVAPTIAASLSGAQATLTWSAVAGATSYNVYQGFTSGGEGVAPSLSGITGSSATVSNLTAGDTCYFEVSAVGIGGVSPRSNEVAVEVPGNAPGELTLASGLNLFSVPYDVHSLSLQAVLGYSDPVLALWSASNDSYFVTPAVEANTIDPGIGYWGRFPQTVVVPNGTGTPVSTTSNFAIGVSAGWTMIGDPFPAAVPISSLLFGPTPSTYSTAVQYDVIGPVIWDYNQSAGEYQAATELQPGVGYWVYSSQGTSIQVPPP